MSEEIKIIDTKERFLFNRIVQLPLILCIIVNGIMWAYVAWKIKPQSDPIYLHYTIYFGVDLIGQWYRIYLLPALGVLVGCINIIISVLFYKKAQTLAYMTLWLTLCYQVVLVFALFLIVRQNI